MPTTIISTSVDLSCNGTGVASNARTGNTRQGAYTSGTIPSSVTSITGTMEFTFSSLATVAQIISAKLTLHCTNAGGNYIKDVQCYATSVDEAQKLTLQATSDIARNKTVYVEWLDTTDLVKILNSIDNNKIILKMYNGEVELTAGSGTDHYTPNYLRADSASLELTFYTREELATVSYYQGNEWHACKLYYYDGSTWVQVKPYYYDGTGWYECRVT